VSINLDKKITDKKADVLKNINQLESKTTEGNDYPKTKLEFELNYYEAKLKK